MKNIIFFALLLFGIACAPKTETKETSTATETVEVETPVQEQKALYKPDTIPSYQKFSEKDLIGYYVGKFRAVNPDIEKDYTAFNKINISIDEMTDGNIRGHSVVAGNDRPFEGTYQQEYDVYKFEVAEPGDDRYDGKFVFQIDAELQELKGDWYANDRKLAVAQRKYSLEKRSFEYNPNLELPENAGWARLSSVYNDHLLDISGGRELEHLTDDVLTVNPSKEKLTKSQVENMYKGDLEVIRNSIYARHGYSFKNRKMRFLFDQYVDWYIPVSMDIRDQLTDLEKENIALLKRYEDHAEKYYDSFGR
ncbi:MAG: YARHG domain-containing protein [Bacteroidota bacterium]